MSERLTEARARLSCEEQEIPRIKSRILSPDRLRTMEATAKNARRAQELDAAIAKAPTESVQNGTVAARKALGYPQAAFKALEAHYAAKVELDRAQARIRDEQRTIAELEKVIH